jgi:hypothetical protein
MKLLLSLSFVACFVAGIQAQNLPTEMSFSYDGHQLLTGKSASTGGGLYDSSIIRNVYLDFSQANYWTLLTNNYTSKTDIPATMTVDGVVYDSVGVRFKGQTSYSMNNTQKKSFNITMDYAKAGQDLMGYKTLNFNNAFQDASFLREVFYQHQIHRHIPAAKSNFIHLYLNGLDWGIYPNVQQLNKTFYEEWFLSNDGVSWRADRPDGTVGGGGPGGGGPGWGDGTAGLNYLGADTSSYKTYYTLKSSGVENPWDLLVEATFALNNTATADLPSVLPGYLDIDRTLWHLASEIGFTDDDSYVYKGKMDYYLYYEPETGRITPVEYDGNSSMETNFATSWSPFYNQNKVNYPLLNKILAVPQWRQRYLAHLRTIMNEEMNPTVCGAMLDNYKSMIDALVEADPKKIYSYAQFNTEVTTLKNFFTTRRNYLLSNAEVSQVGPVIAEANLYNVAGGQWAKPVAGETPYVTTAVTSASGISSIKLYYSAELSGNFTAVDMLDDGQHHDGAANDGLYGASLPAQTAGTSVRFYVEAAANNTAKSVSYLPTGAEHDVFIYQVQPELLAGPVVINEVLAINNSIVQDPQGTYEDWIELYNTSNQAIDLSGYNLSDNAANLAKFVMAAGTTIAANGYLIFWADEDGVDGPEHCNFKLAATGETIYLTNTNLLVQDQVTFGAQTADKAYARSPNGTGNFVVQGPTFNANNNTSATNDPAAADDGFRIVPNPAAGRAYLRLESVKDNDNFVVRDIHGRIFQEGQPTGLITAIDVAAWPAGVYIVQYGQSVRKLIVQ